MSLRRRTDIQRSFSKRQSSFVGRTTEIETIKSVLRQYEAIVLAGSTGVGKFELAKAYTKKYHQNDNVEIFDDISQIKSKFLKKNFWETIKSSLNKNKSKISGQIWICKNVSGIEEFRKIFTEFKKLNGFSKLIATTQNCDKDNWRDVLAFHINPLPKQDAERFLKNQLELKVQFMDVDIEYLAETLGYLPQSLQQAISYILLNKVSVEHFSIRLKDYSFMKRVLEHPVSEDSKSSVFSNFETIFETISNENDALDLFGVLCYLVPTKISFECLNNYPLERQKMINALKLLMKYSLLHKSGNYMNINVPAKFMIFKNEKNAELIEKACDFCTKIRQKIDLSQIGLNIAQDMIPCFNYLISHLKIQSNKTNENFDFLYKISDYLWKSCYVVGDYQNMKTTLHEQWQLATIKFCDEKSEKIDVNRIIKELAHSYYFLEDYKSADYLIKIAHPVYKESKLENSEMAQFLLCFADIRRSLKKYSKADLLYEEAKELCEKGLPNSNVEMAMVLQSMAISKSEQSKFDEADSLFESSQDYFSKNVIENRVIMGSFYEIWADHEILKGNYAAAGAKLEKSYSISLDFYGENHSSTKLIQAKILKNNELIKENVGYKNLLKSSRVPIWENNFHSVHEKNKEIELTLDLSKNIFDTLQDIKKNLIKNSSVENKKSYEFFTNKIKDLKLAMDEKYEELKSEIEKHYRDILKTNNERLIQNYKDLCNWIDPKMEELASNDCGIDTKGVKKCLEKLEIIKKEKEVYYKKLNQFIKYANSCVENDSEQEINEKINRVKSKWEKLIQLISHRESYLNGALNYFQLSENIILIIKQFFQDYSEIFKENSNCAKSESDNINEMKIKYSKLIDKSEKINKRIYLFEKEADDMEDKFPKIKEDVIKIRNSLIEPFKITLKLIPEKKSVLKYYEEYMLLCSWFKEVHEKILEIKLATDVTSAEKSIEMHNEIKTIMDSKYEEIEIFNSKGKILKLGEEHSNSIKTMYEGIEDCKENLFKIWKSKKEILTDSLSYLELETNSKLYEGMENIKIEEMNKRHSTDIKMMKEKLQRQLSINNKFSYEEMKKINSFQPELEEMQPNEINNQFTGILDNIKDIEHKNEKAPRKMSVIFESPNSTKEENENNNSNIANTTHTIHNQDQSFVFIILALIFLIIVLQLLQNDSKTTIKTI